MSAPDPGISCISTRGLKIVFLSPNSAVTSASAIVPISLFIDSACSVALPKKLSGTYLSKNLLNFLAWGLISIAVL